LYSTKVLEESGRLIFGFAVICNILAAAAVFVCGVLVHCISGVAVTLHELNKVCWMCQWLFRLLTN